MLVLFVMLIPFLALTTSAQMTEPVLPSLLMLVAALIYASVLCLIRVIGHRK